MNVSAVTKEQADRNLDLSREADVGGMILADNR